MSEQVQYWNSQGHFFAASGASWTTFAAGSSTVGGLIAWIEVPTKANSHDATIRMGFVALPVLINRSSCTCSSRLDY